MISGGVTSTVNPSEVASITFPALVIPLTVV